ncbi:MAG: PilZ domain-containing protein [Myxococcales bacterium]
MQPMAGEPPSDPSAPLRRYVRKPVAAQLRCRGAMGPGHLFFDTQDLSIGGAFLRADLLLEQGEELEIEFELPGVSQPLRSRARVAWVRRGETDRSAPGMGIEFLDLSPGDRQALADFLEDS